MAARRPPSDQLDLLTDWHPPAIVDRYEERRVRGAGWRDRLARAVSVTLGDCEMARDEVARLMSETLGEEVSVAMLDAYASVAKADHTISAVRLLALMAVTGDVRPLQMLADQVDRAVIPERYLGAVEAEILRDQRETLERKEKAARRRWKGGR